MILEDTAFIRAGSLPIALRGEDWKEMSFVASAAGGESVDGLSLADQERRLVVQALENTEGNQTQAARLLRITRDTLRYKMKKFNLR
jgi:DNA-binding NtrC family response regulator